MKVKEIIEELESRIEYKDCKKEKPDSFLAHIFNMDDEANKDSFQIGFYNIDDSITTFILGKNKCEVIPNAEVFKKPDSKVKKLEIEKVRIETDEADDIASALMKNKYQNESSTKRILILQSIDIGTIYNITYITQSLNMLNIKIDAETGEIKEEKLSSLMDLKAK